MIGKTSFETPLKKQKLKFASSFLYSPLKSPAPGWQYETREAIAVVKLGITPNHRASDSSRKRRLRSVLAPDDAKGYDEINKLRSYQPSRSAG
jgi:hypothetical protein